ncbi:hypothetical protein JTB14_020548, partial [Gonioctena quinquepunctata]
GGGAPYWVLATDYDKYAIVWSCHEIGPLVTRVAWILTREMNPSQDLIEKAYKDFDDQEISKSFLQKTDRKNCPEE